MQQTLEKDWVMPLQTENGKRNSLLAFSFTDLTMHQIMSRFYYRPRQIEILEGEDLVGLGSKNLGCCGKNAKGWSWNLGLTRVEV